MEYSPVELSIVIPCLNEADTLADCIMDAKQSIKENGISGEIIVADNGSIDGSQEIAESLGAKVVKVKDIGYGNALMEGINNAMGKYIIMADADASYKFSEISKFIERLRKGYSLVMGCRFPSGGGKILPGAMPVLHRWIGNPLFSFLARSWFNAPIYDVHCGMRGFTKEFYSKLDMHCTGMEFASEMVIKASSFSSMISEVPITLYPDGRKTSKKHLKTFRDGWRHLRFYLMFSPKWLFFIPGILLVLIGILGYLVVIPSLKVFDRIFDVHTLLFASLFIICGYQSIVFAILANTYVINEGLKPKDVFMTKFWNVVKLEIGLLTGMLLMLCGITLLAGIIYYWMSINFGSFDYRITMRWIIPGVTLTALGFQTVLLSFFGSILGLKKK